MSTGRTKLKQCAATLLSELDAMPDAKRVPDWNRRAQTLLLFVYCQDPTSLPPTAPAPAPANTKEKA
jgi:hypothetical protein